jgi:hypothetical protein
VTATICAIFCRLALWVAEGGAGNKLSKSSGLLQALVIEAFLKSELDQH